MIRIAICNYDEAWKTLWTEIIRNEVSEYGILSCFEEYKINDFSLEDLDSKYFDLIFFNTSAQNLKGMEFLKKMKNKFPNSLIIIISSRIKYIYEVIELSVFRFITKDEVDVRLKQATRDSVSNILSKSNEIYIIETKYHIQKIMIKDIQYIRKNEKYAIIVTKYGEVSIRESLQHIFTEINNDQFIYVDKGCIVNYIYIKKMEHGEIEMIDGTYLPVSRSNRKNVKDLLLNQWKTNYHGLNKESDN